jgi:hypothetical protein
MGLTEQSIRSKGGGVGGTSTLARPKQSSTKLDSFLKVWLRSTLTLAHFCEFVIHLPQQLISRPN